MRSQWRTWMISAVALGAVTVGTTAMASGRRHRRSSPRRPSGDAGRGRRDHDRPRLRADQPRPAPRRRRRRAGDQRQHLRDPAHPHARRRAAPGAGDRRCRRRSTTRRGSSRSAKASRSTTASRSTPTPSWPRSSAWSASSSAARPTTTASTPRSRAPKPSTSTRSDHDRRPRRRAAGAHVLAQADPGRAPRRRRTCPTSRSAPVRTVREPRTRVSTSSIAANADYWGGGGTIGQRHLRVLRRRGDPPRRAEVGRVRPDHQPRAVGRRAGPAVRAPSRARSTRSSSSMPTRASPPTPTSGAPSTSPSTRTPSPRTRSAATPRSTPASCCRRRSSATTTPSSRYAYDPEEAERLLEEAGVAGASIQLDRRVAGAGSRDRELLEAIAGYWTAAGLDVQLEILEFGAYLDVLFDRENRADAIYVSSSNDLLDPDRQLSTYYEAGGIGSSNSDEEMAALIAAGRSELDPEVRQTTYEEAAADRLRPGLLRVARQQRGHLRHVGAPPVDAACRRQAAGRRDERRRIVLVAERPMGVFMTERSGRHPSVRRAGSGLSGEVHQRTARPGRDRRHRRHRARVRRHPDDRRSCQLHPAAVGLRGAARGAPCQPRLRPVDLQPVRVVSRRRHPSRLRRVHLLPQRSSARHRHAFPPQDAATGRRRDEHRLLHVDPPRGDLRPSSGTPPRQDARHVQPHRPGLPAVLHRPGHLADHEREVQPRPVRRRAVDAPDLPGDHPGAAGDRPADDGRALGDDRRTEQPVRQGG